VNACRKSIEKTKALSNAGHSASAPRGTKGAILRREGKEPVPPAQLAPKPKKFPVQDTAIQMSAKFVFHEGRNRPFTLLSFGEKCLQISSDDRIEDGGSRIAWVVRRRFLHTYLRIEIASPFGEAKG